MTYNNVAKKGLTVGIILLFLMIGFSPIINANDNRILSDVSHAPQTRGSAPMTVIEYKPDGTIEKTVIRMSQEQADNFNEEMINAHDLNARLSIYIKCHLISQNITADSLQSGMEEKAHRLGITQHSLLSLIKSGRKISQVYRNIFCFVSADNFGGGAPLMIPFGISLFTGLFGIPGFDVADFFFDFGGSFVSVGLLGDERSSSINTITLVGFVGLMRFYYHNFLGFAFDGFCIYAQARTY
jgi:hypothetical protein